MKRRLTGDGGSTVGPMDAYGVEATSETQKWRRRDPEIDPKEKEQCSFVFFFQWQCMNGKGDRLMKRPPWSPCPYRQFVCCDISACMLLLLMMMSIFCMVCVFFIILPAYVILGSLNYCQYDARAV